jgi:hypothetical protein
MLSVWFVLLERPSRASAQTYQTVTSHQLHTYYTYRTSSSLLHQLLASSSSIDSTFNIRHPSLIKQVTLNCVRRGGASRAVDGYHSYHPQCAGVRCDAVHHVHGDDGDGGDDGVQRRDWGQNHHLVHVYSHPFASRFHRLHRYHVCFSSDVDDVGFGLVRSHCSSLWRCCLPRYSGDSCDGAMNEHRHSCSCSGCCWVGQLQFRLHRPFSNLVF